MYHYQQSLKKHKFILKRIAIFCGSNSGNDPEYILAAKSVGKILAQNKIEVVYGGSNAGLMGVVADSVIENSGVIKGVIPDFLMSKELAHQNLSELIVVGSMHERKSMMNDLCDGVIALPGGFGTLDELFEMLTWGQLGLHSKPVGILNTKGFYDALLVLVESMVGQGFLKEINSKMLLVSSDIEDLLGKMRRYQPSGVQKWMGIDQI